MERHPRSDEAFKAGKPDIFDTAGRGLGTFADLGIFSQEISHQEAPETSASPEITESAIPTTEQSIGKQALEYSAQWQQLITPELSHPIDMKRALELEKARAEAFALAA